VLAGAKIDDRAGDDVVGADLGAVAFILGAAEPRHQDSSAKNGECKEHVSRFGAPLAITREPSTRAHMSLSKTRDNVVIALPFVVVFVLAVQPPKPISSLY
jgi:hypothetical protein